jgi:hypothetical protein
MDPNDLEEALLAGEGGQLIIERSDADEVGIHFIVDDTEEPIASIYTTRIGAIALAYMLQQKASA